ncbi:MAG: tryptophan 2,3-dioxygenase family protein [Bacteroidia bacterium]
MSENIIDPEVVELISKLKTKYDQNGQDFKAYLEGLVYQEYTSYWDYIQVDTLLSLQKPKTDIPDELIFIMYHQITELYFKLTLHEIKQLQAKKSDLTAEFLTARLKRMIAYFRNLTNSFEIMIEGMEPAQFLKFRMSLLPASGFQSAQYRMIEILSTPLINLVGISKRDELKSASKEEQFANIYWKNGATELSSGKKTLTLTQFEEKYSDDLFRMAIENQNSHLSSLFHQLSTEEQSNGDLREAMKNFDLAVNVHWPLVHYKSAVRYLQKSPADIAATGGTNWQKYLPPRFQFRIFFPELYSPEELENWGKNG